MILDPDFSFDSCRTLDVVQWTLFRLLCSLVGEGWWSTRGRGDNVITRKKILDVTFIFHCFPGNCKLLLQYHGSYVLPPLPATTIGLVTSTVFSGSTPGLLRRISHTYVELLDTPTVSTEAESRSLGRVT